MHNNHYATILLQKGLYDESVSSFFRNVDTRHDDPTNIPLGDSRGKIRHLKARVCTVPTVDTILLSHFHASYKGLLLSFENYQDPISKNQLQ